jgi:predicted nuclease of predicted toxin-antitoxin system
VRLLFDEQLSEELVTMLEELFPDSLHIRLGAGGSSDSRIWQLALEHSCLLVTKDEDFHRLSILRGAPPKVIWLRVGNCSGRNRAIVQTARRRCSAIRSTG